MLALLSSVMERGMRYLIHTAVALRSYWMKRSPVFAPVPVCSEDERK